MPEPEAESLQMALAEWRTLLTPSRVLDSGPELTAAGEATFRTAQNPIAILRPGSTAEVQECVRIANRARIPLYPVSGGKNWGFGSRVPPRDGSVLVDLSRMARIVDFDETLGTMTVEPGVTFGAAYLFLRERRSRLFLSTTGSSPHSSIVGNAVERGDGSGPYGDHFAHVCSLEVVLPTGECIHTGFGRFEGSRVSALHRFGVGPAFDGLFSQSGLGIVTRMTVWLSPLPACLHLVRFTAGPSFAPVVDALRTLRMDGTVRSPVGLWNDYRVVSADRQYPWEETGGKTPLSPERLAALGAKAAWHGSLSLYAPTLAQGRANRAHVESRLAPVVETITVEEYTGDAVSGAEHARGDPAALFAQGVPHEESLRSTYFRKKSPVPRDPDPDRDRCGVLWVCPTLPFVGADAERAAAPARETMLRHGFEPMLAMIAQSERTLYLVPVLVYDRDVPGEDERASACHDELLTRFCEQGYHPHRLGIQSMRSLPRARDDYGTLLRRIKRALDPNDVLAPGRYDFRED